MSAEINNREQKQAEAAEKEQRKQVLKDIIRQLHEGRTVEEVKAQFEETFGEVSAREITEAEQELILSGTKVEEIQSLCDVHASVFKGSIEEIHNPKDPGKISGHPVRTLMLENRAIETLMQKEIKDNLEAYQESGNDVSHHALVAGLERLTGINLHYMKKENLLFPYMEKYGITAPPQVMWGVDDEIRAEIKEVLGKVKASKKIDEELAASIDHALERVAEMIFKEEQIMIPMLTENLTQDEWKIIADESVDLGYFLIKTPPVWQPEKEYQKEAAAVEEALPSGTVTLPTGSFTVEELTKVLNTLPIDITFVDKNDRVKYFSEASERIFPRTRAIIGREVANCHPPASVHIVRGLSPTSSQGKRMARISGSRWGPTTSSSAISPSGMITATIWVPWKSPRTSARSRPSPEKSVWHPWNNWIE